MKETDDLDAAGVVPQPLIGAADAGSPAEPTHAGRNHTTTQEMPTERAGQK